MRRSINIRVLLVSLIGLIVVSGGIHFLHDYQMKSNAQSLRIRADRALKDEKTAQAFSYYTYYLRLCPNDVDTLLKYLPLLEQRATKTERISLIDRMEKVLLVRPDEHAMRHLLVKQLIMARRLDDATRHVKTLLERQGNQADYHHMLGWCQEARQKYRDAVLSFQEAIRIDPTRLESYLLLVEVFQDRLNLPDEATRVMQQMIEANPKSPTAFLSRARFYLARHQSKEADEDFNQAQKLGPDDIDVVFALTERTQSQGKFPDAIAILQQALEKHPRHTGLMRTWAAIELRAGNHTSAVTVLRKACEQVPDDYDLILFLCDILLDEGTTALPEVEQQLRTLKKKGIQSAYYDLLQVRLTACRGELTKAISLAEQARLEYGARSKWSSRLNFLLAEIYHQTGERFQEMSALRRASSAEPDWSMPRFSLGSVLLEEGRLEEALTELASLRKATDLPTDYWSLYAQSLLAYTTQLPESQRSWKEVFAALTEAERISGRTVETTLLWAETYSARQDFGVARELLIQQRLLQPQEISLWCTLADISYRQGLDREAEDILSEAERKFGSRLELRLSRARLWSRLAKNDELPKMRRILTNLNAEASTERVRIWRELADTFLRLGDRDEAVRLYQAIIQTQPHDLRSRFLLFEIATDSKQLKIASEHLDQIKQLEGRAGKYGTVGDLILRLNDPRTNRAALDEIRSKFESLLTTHRDWSAIPYQLAKLDDRRGEPERSLQNYRKALELGELRPELLQRLLSLLAERQDFSTAEETLQRYLSQQALSPALARRAAEVSLGNHNFTQALKRAEIAVPLPSRDYRDYLWLAGICQAAGNQVLAETQLWEALRQAEHAPDTWLALVNHFAQSKQTERADDLLAAMQERLPADSAMLTYAQALEILGYPDRAREAYEQVLSQRPDDWMALYQASNFYRRIDQDPKAIQLCKRLLEPGRGLPAEIAIPARRQLAILLAEHCLEQGGESPLAEADALLETNRKLMGRTLAEERIEMFVRGVRFEQRDQALTQYLQSLKQQQATAEQRYLFARLYEAAGKLRFARDEIAFAVAQEPRCAQYLARYIRLLIRTGELVEARDFFDRLITLEPEGERTRGLREALIRAGVAQQ